MTDATFGIDREEFVDLADTDGPAVVRVEAELAVDADPLDAYAALTGRTTEADAADYGFLLESAEKVPSSDPDGAFAPAPAERHARFSFVGYDPAAVVTVDGGEGSVEVLDDRYDGLVTTNGGDTLDTLRDALPDVSLRGMPDRDRQHLDGGLVGFLAYDAVYDLHLAEVGVDPPESATPDAQFVLTTRTLAFDHAEDTLSLVCTPVVRPGDDAGARYDDLVAELGRVTDLLTEAAPLSTGGFRPERERAGERDRYEEAVETAKEAVFDGEIYQGVISRTRELYGDVDSLGLYEALRDINPSPYMYVLSYGDRTIVGASPETLVSVGNEQVVSNPIAGTCPRGSSPVEDRRLAGEMLADDKERAEHTMLVDLARNDVRRVAEPGSVRVQEFMNVLKYSHVQHIESTVTGTLGADSDAFDAVRASFPAGTLSGAPKMRAMELIDDLESSPRGVYGGGVGYVSWQGDADFAIVIRSATIEPAGESDCVTVRAGAGVVADSDPVAEYEETEKKMDGVLSALDRIEETVTEARQ
ncbi:anthranilate synthase, component I [Halovenus aranensis]|uniref:Anthranilate synthase component 1 n=1 Tax=Halovenus aranensis TaxID=890420 RepID=A0A1G8X017_9EURY|nr:anthranilate synthase component I [Halovenus aranensis]SDJ83185.1 anthranilate synthase, component I [Halovenus aranensis]